MLEFDGKRPSGAIPHKNVDEMWTVSNVHNLSAKFIHGEIVYFEVEKTQPRQRYRLPHNAFAVLAFFFPLVFLREIRFLRKMSYTISLEVLAQIPYTAFGSFFWALGYSKEAWNAYKRRGREV